MLVLCSNQVGHPLEHAINQRNPRCIRSQHRRWRYIRGLQAECPKKSMRYSDIQSALRASSHREQNFDGISQSLLEHQLEQRGAVLRSCSKVHSVPVHALKNRRILGDEHAEGYTVIIANAVERFQSDRASAFILQESLHHQQQKQVSIRNLFNLLLFYVHSH